MKKKPVMLMILDGWGIAAPSAGNAATLARTPHLTRLLKVYPHTRLKCSGEAVGLPEGQMGNSEVGHLNIGAGRVVFQELTRITNAVCSGALFKNSVLNELMEQVKSGEHALHLMGLVSDGGVHSHQEHLYALLKMAKLKGVERVYVHAFLDGRDVPPQSAVDFIEALEQEITVIGCGSIATVSGRYYAMDRDKRWDRVAKAYKNIVRRDGQSFASAAEGIRASYAQGVNDEFVVPFCVGEDDVSCVHRRDGILFFNFRPDRARELTRAFVDKEFPYFERCDKAMPVHFVCMTQYDETIPVSVAFPPEEISNTLGQVIATAGLKQLRIAETEKYAHVTFFFNGGVEVPNEGEERILIPSPKVATYDLQPEMSAYLVTEKLLQVLDEDKYDLIILNFANPDMVGHTGILSAAVAALEAVDECVGGIATKVLGLNGVLCITADHGNLECMIDPVTHAPYTAHTTNPVFFIMAGNAENRQLHPGSLCDIAPTLLELLHIDKPDEMTGSSLINKK